MVYIYGSCLRSYLSYLLTINGSKYWEQVAALDYFNEFKRNRKKYQTGYNYHRLHYFSVRFLMETLKFQQEVQDKFGTKKRSRSLAEVNLN